MRDPGDEASTRDVGLYGRKPALQVICLGSSGGPSEENVTSFLVRSASQHWARGSVVSVDAGSHLGPLTRIFERECTRNRSNEDSRSQSRNGGGGSAATPNVGALRSSSFSEAVKLEHAAEHHPPEPTVLSSGTFAGLKLPNETAGANALHFLRTYISTYLITHPHLDHISGFTINTAAFHATSRPKTLAALPSTVDALKQHIFNDVIWPNLTDEDGGVGFVTFQRLKEGGDVMLGEGEGRGYIDVCDGLGVRAFKVSHGVCTKCPPSHFHRGSNAGVFDSQAPYDAPGLIPMQDLSSTARARSFSISHSHSGMATPGGARQSFQSPHLTPTETSCVVDSTALFIRDVDSQREVLIFGDVEPDSLSMSPRNHVVWREAAHKIAHGLLGGILIESSYDDSQADAVLFGHLNPRHLIAELQTLAAMVNEAKSVRSSVKGNEKKRKRSYQSGNDSLARFLASGNGRKRSRGLAESASQSDERRRSSGTDRLITDASTAGNASPVSPSTQPPYDSNDGNAAHVLDGTSPQTAPASTSGWAPEEAPLHGIRIVIIHVKDTFQDGPHVSENILAQLQEHEQRLQSEGHRLGCEFVISQSGESYYF